jgi:hypothetical protein
MSRPSREGSRTTSPAATLSLPFDVINRGISASALLMVQRYGEHAVAEAALRAEELEQAGDSEGCATWCRIWDAAAMSKPCSNALFDVAGVIPERQNRQIDAERRFR